MNILTLDTTTSVGTVGLIAKDRVVVEERSSGLLHAETLVPTIKHLVGKAGWTMTAIEGIAVAIGPGSFTGLRIGIATAKGIALALHLPIVGVSSLAIIAANRPAGDGVAVPLIDARRGEIYGSAVCFARDHRLFTAIGDAVMSPALWCDRLATLRQHGRLWLAGDGALRYRALFEQRLGKSLEFAADEGHVPHAMAIAHISLQQLLRGGDEIVSLVPTYIRQSDAEIGFAG